MPEFVLVKGTLETKQQPVVAVATTESTLDSSRTLAANANRLRLNSHVSQRIRMI